MTKFDGGLVARGLIGIEFQSGDPLFQLCDAEQERFDRGGVGFE